MANVAICSIGSSIAPLIHVITSPRLEEGCHYRRFLYRFGISNQPHLEEAISITPYQRNISENGVPENVDLDENSIHEDCVNGDSTSHKTEIDGEIGVEVNGDVSSQPHEKELVTECKDDVIRNQNEKVESSTNNFPNMRQELKSKQIQEEKQKSFVPKPTSPTPTSTLLPAQTRPAGLGNGAPLLELAHRRPEQTPHNLVVAQVLYRLGLAEQLRGKNGGRVAAFNFELASAMAEHELEPTGQEPLDMTMLYIIYDCYL
ncbi:hypothetical protein L1887_44487 [Cichorium endivia]|nr:hypothetical protein L1887_44487 [Cichorium endivia]